MYVFGIFNFDFDHSFIDRYELSLILVAFDMYDVDNDGLISKDELLSILHMMVGANIRYTYDINTFFSYCKYIIKTILI